MTRSYGMSNSNLAVPIRQFSTFSILYQHAAGMAMLIMAIVTSFFFRTGVYLTNSFLDRPAGTVLKYPQIKQVEARQTSVPESNARQQLCGKGNAAEGSKACLRRDAWAGGEDLPDCRMFLRRAMSGTIPPGCFSHSRISVMAVFIPINTQKERVL